MAKPAATKTKKKIKRVVTDGIELAAPECFPACPRATPARGSVRCHPRPESLRESPILPAGARCPARRSFRQRPREPPFKFAFFSRLSYWCDIRCACTWAMKSITTTTTISSEVPPK